VIAFGEEYGWRGYLQSEGIREKMPMAFFRISRSIRSCSFSRRNRASSAALTGRARLAHVRHQPYTPTITSLTQRHAQRFWSYVIAALDTLAAGVGTTALALLQTPQPPPIERILTGVLNAFTSPNAVPVRDIALVLDDYQVITAPAIHDALAWLIEHLPPQLHLVIITRADPALPLARLRARGVVTEVHKSDLRFTPD